MTISIDLVFLTQGLILASLLGAVGYIRSVRNELRNLNGRLIKLEEWRNEHNVSAAEIQKTILRELDWLRKKHEE